MVSFADLPPDKDLVNCKTRMKIVAGTIAADTTKGVDNLNSEANPSVKHGVKTI